MATFFLIIIYMTFISLGLPDALLGSAWPIMQMSLKVPISSAGIVQAIITTGTIVSSFLSGKLIKRFSTASITLTSVFITALALFGFYIVPNFILICFMAIPLGLGAGAVDSALNNFIALRYKAIHMNWLHSFWGIGATFGPIIMSICIKNNNSWRDGYFTISIIQFILVFILFITLPVFKRFESKNAIKESKKIKTDSKLKNILKIKGVKLSLISFFFYSGLEATTGLWATSYLVMKSGFTPDKAARITSIFYFGIMLGRFINGFATLNIKNKMLIRTGQILCIVGILFLIIPVKTLSILSLIVIGLGAAPIFPSMLQETPNRFGKYLSQHIIGNQMAFAYMGSAAMPALLGFIIIKSGIAIFPFFILIYSVIMLISSEKINKILKIN